MIFPFVLQVLPKSFAKEPRNRGMGVLHASSSDMPTLRHIADDAHAYVVIGSDVLNVMRLSHAVGDVQARVVNVTAILTCKRRKIDISS